MKKTIRFYLPGYAKDRIENAHGMIIELRKKKADLFAENSLISTFSLIGKDNEIAVIDEQIKQWEEVVKLWSGKLDPSRNKFIWSIVVPIFVSVVISLLIAMLGFKI